MSRSRAERARAAGLVAVVLIAAGSVLLGCAADAEARRPARATKDRAKAVEEGRASYYGDGFDGRRTASGERYDPHKLTAAHKSLPLGTRVRVTRVSGGVDGPSVEVRVNDRCGCTHGRLIDLSLAAAKRLHMLGSGVVPVRIEVLARAP